MNNTLSITAVLSLIGLLTIPLVYSSDEGEWGEYRRHSTGVKAVEHPLYQQECGSCHMAYPAGLLPAASWQALMTGLDDHFGDNAELDANSQQQITDYLVANSAEKSDYRRSRKFISSLKPGDAPLRISETPYFRHEHDEIPARLVKDNPEVGSFSQCNACHQGAERGFFNEDNIRIPGFGRWDD